MAQFTFGRQQWTGSRSMGPWTPPAGASELVLTLDRSSFVDAGRSVRISAEVSRDGGAAWREFASWTLAGGVIPIGQESAVLGAGLATLADAQTRVRVTAVGIGGRIVLDGGVVDVS